MIQFSMFCCLCPWQVVDSSVEDVLSLSCGDGWLRARLACWLILGKLLINFFGDVLSEMK
jgi:hypothetical protein